MKVSVIFDPAFGGSTSGAVWIVNTPANREWFEQQCNLDTGSAIFAADRYPSLDAAAVHMVWNAQEHHPAWETISVEGIDLTPHITEALAHAGRIIGSATGFAVYRV